jgi:ppGpp synthetase/RelA/SpoT-type nucleotidyltranferase
LAREFSKSQVDRLGERLREASTELDLKLLDEYRLAFREAYEHVVRTLRDELHLEPTGRAAKSTSSVIEKLRRESIRLSQVQDLAGCRIVVRDVAEQNAVVASLRKAFPEATIIDRRAAPSHGYRAVHVVVRASGRLVEIQVRTELQHLWAELSEQFADAYDPQLKYGGGDAKLRAWLMDVSKQMTLAENESPARRSEIERWLTPDLRSILQQLDKLKAIQERLNRRKP